jgi:hypothetical protein
VSRTEPPYDRLGVFKELSDVPDGRRLYHLAPAYEGRDTWGDYRATVELSDRMSVEWDRFARRWKEHMDERGRHHALARPDDVETWSAELVGRFSVDRAYQHWNVIEGFYDWLLWHTEHQHAYNPFHMAVVDPEGSARQIWNRKLEKANE